MWTLHTSLQLAPYTLCRFKVSMIKSEDWGRTWKKDDTSFRAPPRLKGASTAHAGYDLILQQLLPPHYIKLASYAITPNYQLSLVAFPGT